MKLSKLVFWGSMATSAIGIGMGVAGLAAGTMSGAAAAGLIGYGVGSALLTACIIKPGETKGLKVEAQKTL